MLEPIILPGEEVRDVDLGFKRQREGIIAGTVLLSEVNDLRPYKQKRVSKMFTLYFIPLFETKNLGEFVECQVCRSGFDPKDFGACQPEHVQAGGWLPL